MIQLEYANCLAERVGETHGLVASDLDAGRAMVRDASAALEGRRGTGWEGWRRLAEDPMRSSHLGAIDQLADDLLPRCDNLIVLGIGGSALGNIALQSALNPPTWNLLDRDAREGPRLFVLDNVDPKHVGDTLDFIEDSDPGLRRTFVNVVSKSGETAETASQFLILRERLERTLGADASNHIIAITDPSKGTMRAICDAAGYRTLPVPDGVGGRFSVLSPVGLFSAAMCGIDIGALLDGASAMEERCRSGVMEENPAALLAWIHTAFGTRTTSPKPIHVMMPYANRLYDLADWYRQLWAESLGKRVNRDGDEVFTGFTPVKALGTTDQHSQVQLYREGPNDKVVGFLDVERRDRELSMPQDAREDALSYLAGQTMNDLIAAEKRATEFALVESERPNYTIRFPSVDEFNVGAFLMLWQMATAFAGEFLSIDAYDQPAVETGKKATFGLMGRAGFEDWRQQVDERLAPSEFVL